MRRGQTQCIDSSPSSYARHLTTYIKDPSTVRARTMEEFARAPTIPEIVQMRQRYEAERQREARPTYIKEPPDNDGEDFVVVPLIKPPATLGFPVRPKPRKRTPWPSWYTPPSWRARNAPDVVVARVCEALEIEIKVFMAATSRGREYVNGRAIVAKLLRGQGMSYPQIARALNRKDHSTIINLMDVFEGRVAPDERLMSLYRAMLASGA